MAVLRSRLVRLTCTGCTPLGGLMGDTGFARVHTSPGDCGTARADRSDVHRGRNVIQWLLDCESRPRVGQLRLGGSSGGGYPRRRADPPKGVNRVAAAAERHVGETTKSVEVVSAQVELGRVLGRGTTDGGHVGAIGQRRRQTAARSRCSRSTRFGDPGICAKIIEWRSQPAACFSAR